MTGNDPTSELNRFVLVIGPTAGGKSSLALGLAQKLDGEIVNCDSVQLYRGFDIGAAKPSASDRELVPHHLFDILDSKQTYDAAQYSIAAREVIRQILARGKVPFLVGGTGLYVRALLGQSFHDLPNCPDLRGKIQEMQTEELIQQLELRDPERLAQLHPNDRFRLERALEIAMLSGRTFAEQTSHESSQLIRPIATIYCNPKVADSHRKIADRTLEMIQSGLILEVQNLLKDGCLHNSKPMQSIGYRQVAEYLTGKIDSIESLQHSIVVATRQYAKRQRTWFKKVPADITSENPSNLKEFEKIASLIEAKLKL